MLHEFPLRRDPHQRGHPGRERDDDVSRAARHVGRVPRRGGISRDDLMDVTVYQGRVLIGTGVLQHLDPPMGVAFGPFMPNGEYDRDEYANVIEGEYVDDRGKSLTLHVPHGALQTAWIAIEDWHDPEVGKHLSVGFKDSEDFATHFSEHPEYRAYYAQ